jgi:hypothetical protein
LDLSKRGVDGGIHAIRIDEFLGDREGVCQIGRVIFDDDPNGLAVHPSIRVELVGG